MNGVVVWLTGLPSSGKSTLARRVLEEGRRRKIPCCMLDGDEVRGALVPTPGYDDQARRDFYATLGALAAMLAGQGMVVLVPATANQRSFRDQARELAPRFVEVFVDVSLELCKERDAKGLYARAAEGDVDDMPGVGTRYEAPTHPDVIAQGGEDERARDRILALATS